MKFSIKDFFIFCTVFISRAFLSNSLKLYCYSFSLSSEVFTFNVDSFILLSLIDFVCFLASNCLFLVAHCNVDFINFFLQVFRLVAAICFSKRWFWIVSSVCIELLMSALEWDKMKLNPLSFAMLCAISYNLYNLKIKMNLFLGVWKIFSGRPIIKWSTVWCNTVVRLNTYKRWLSSAIYYTIFPFPTDYSK